MADLIKRHVSGNGKGDKPRPVAVGGEEFARRWAQTFQKTLPCLTCRSVGFEDRCALCGGPKEEPKETNPFFSTMAEWRDRLGIPETQVVTAGFDPAHEGERDE